MNTVALLYHDVVEANQSSASGFSGADADIYKLETGRFEAHLSAFERVSNHLVITVDDGGVSAHTHIADRLEMHGRRGFFFIATDWIGRPAFLDRNWIRELRERGHLIGSHSCSHPPRLSHCSWTQICDEWSRSIIILSDILGEPVQAASVPGGFYSRDVARAASLAGIRTLFTSEPTLRVEKVDNCTVIGRFMIQRSTTAAEAASLAQGSLAARMKQASLWNAKKCIKKVGGETWLRFRKWALQQNA
jgi:peptidoglycan/xylan/chitin deacetylase (PgdA/CDA1 family)